MGKLLALYDSASGNTTKMAGLVAEGAGSILGLEVRRRRVAEAAPEDVLWCDGLALGSPTNMGLLSWKMKRFWDEPNSRKPSPISPGRTGQWCPILYPLSTRKGDGEE
jgi:NAD(P)H dehydrogenase (quinone)